MTQECIQKPLDYSQMKVLPLILLQYMSSTELNEYANDNDKLDSLIKDLHQVVLT